jgi:phytoene desaturase
MLQPMNKSAVVIGSGFSGLSVASCLAKEGYKVTVLEKNEMAGGRCSVFSDSGFTFDMGPSWYWMPDTFEHYFSIFGKKVSDYYQLEQLDPSYRIFWGKDNETDIPAAMSKLEELFESWEKGAAEKLRQYMKEAAYKYERGINDFVYRPSNSWVEFADPTLLPDLLKMQLLSSLESHVRGMFKDERIRRILEFPVYFLGALPSKIPALYSLMNYADLQLGTWYPKGGMYKIVEGMEQLAKELGVTFHYHTPVDRVETSSGKISAVYSGERKYSADVFVNAADYHHFEQEILPPQHRKYDETYWDKRVMAPSSLIFYLGINKRVHGLQHHNLFFDASFEQFGKEIYDTPQWPTDPLFYVCCPSLTDASVAPEGMENVFVLIPIAPDLQDDDATRERYFNLILNKLELYTGQKLQDHVIYKKSFAIKDFKERYNGYKGNAYGLANTLMQTAIFKPSIRNPHLSNLYNTGQLSVPGPGVPPSLISGQVVAAEVLKDQGKVTDFRPKA